jgi:hypothetical protein
LKNNGATSTVGLKIFVVATCPPVVDVIMAGHMSIHCDYLNLTEPIDPNELVNIPIFNRGLPPIIHALLGPQSSINLGGIGINEASIRAITTGFPCLLKV